MLGGGSLHGLRAGSYPCGGETASDDVPVRGNLPVPAAGRTVQGDAIRKGVFSSHDTPPWKPVERGNASVSVKKLTNGPGAALAKNPKCLPPR